jgi:Uma2 family endonuclease
MLEPGLKKSRKLSLFFKLEETMVLAESAIISFDDFINWLPERSAYRYELRDGEIIEMPKPRGKHSEIAGSIIAELNFVIRQAQLSYIIPRELIVKSINGRSGYEPDIAVLDQSMLSQEPNWETGSIITQGSSVKLVVEVVSTNWQDDYAIKQIAYQNLGIQEYWIIDYLGLGGRTFIGYPKQPVFSVYSLVDNEYNLQQFRGGELIQSSIFPDLQLSIASCLG